jgi:DNA topoisomerase-1
LKALAKLLTYKELAGGLLVKTKLKPKEGKKTDPAHPAVYPTFETPDLKKLNARQKKLYDLIVRRFMACFGDKALRESMKVILDMNKNKFILTGKRTIEPGWTKFYKKYLAFEEQLLPELKVDQVLKVIKIDLLEKETQPPGRYSQGSIVKEMEKHGLGTRATRAEILQTLINRGYISGRSVHVTKLGETVTRVLKKFCPRILDEKLTRHFEKETDLVFKRKKKREKIGKEAKKFLVGVLKDFKKNEKKIGKKLLEGLIIARREERKLGTCPNCGGELRVIVSRRTRKRFAGCSSYPKCKTGFPLPQFGKIIPLHKDCEVCGLPMIQVWRKGKRPFRMCINHKCKSKEGWGKNKTTKKKSKS